MFDYDPATPLDVAELSTFEAGEGVVHDISYASPLGGRVPAYLAVPHGRGPFAGVVMQHGLPGSRERYLAYGARLAHAGAVVLMISAPFAREENGHVDEPISFTERDRDEQIQLVVDLRRGVDLLTARGDVDPVRLAYVGRSYGAAVGGLLAAVEKRITSFVLAVGDGGLVTHFRPTDGRASPLDELSAARRRRWLRAMEPIEPIRFVGRAAPSALFFQAALRDQFVPRADAVAFQAAGSEPKLVRWYDAEHALDEGALRDQVEWLAVRAGLDAARFPPVVATGPFPSGRR